MTGRSGGAGRPEESAETLIRAEAIWLARPRMPEFRMEPVAPPCRGEVRVRTIASAISQGTELLVYRGQVPADLPLDLPTLAGSFAFPVKYGYATVGRVVDTGDGVQGFAPGDTVFVHHPHQSAFVVPATMPVRLPDGIDPVLGLFTANLETAVNVLLDTPLHFGETALVFGQGTVGALIAQLLKRAGAMQVIVVDPIPLRREIALSLGADYALEPCEDLSCQVLALTEGRGADVAIEASGVGAALQCAIDSVADEGTVMVVSWYGTKPLTLQLGGRFHRGRVRLCSSQVGRLDPALAPRWDRARRTAVAVDLLSKLHLEELITHRFPFKEAPAAYRLVDECPVDAMQVILLYDSE
jgi:2-desacetyl-2-hydroxyethyl bacteriochlorophyllide A dehydrogenase